MILLLLGVVLLLSGIFFFAGHYNQLRTLTKKYSLLCEFLLVTTGAFLGLFLSLAAQEAIKTRDATERYEDALIAMREVAIDHMIAINDRLDAPTVYLRLDEDNNPDALQEVQEYVNGLNRLTVSRAIALVEVDELALVGSNELRRFLNDRTIHPYGLDHDTNWILDIGGTLQRSLKVSSYLVEAVAFELAFLRGRINKDQLNDLYACFIDIRVKVDGGDCSSAFSNGAELLYGSSNHKDEVADRRFRHLEQCVELGGFEQSTCISLIREIIQR